MLSNLYVGEVSESMISVVLSVSLSLSAAILLLSVLLIISIIISMQLLSKKLCIKREHRLAQKLNKNDLYNNYYFAKTLLHEMLDHPIQPLIQRVIMILHYPLIW